VINWAAGRRGHRIRPNAFLDAFPILLRRLQFTDPISTIPAYRQRSLEHCDSGTTRRLSCRVARDGRTAVVLPRRQNVVKASGSSNGHYQQPRSRRPTRLRLSGGGPDSRHHLHTVKLERPCGGNQHANVFRDGFTCTTTSRCSSAGLVVAPDQMPRQFRRRRAILTRMRSLFADVDLSDTIRCRPRHGGAFRRRRDPRSRTPICWRPCTRRWRISTGPYLGMSDWDFRLAASSVGFPLRRGEWGARTLTLPYTSSSGFVACGDDRRPCRCESSAPPSCPRSPAVPDTSSLTVARGYQPDRLRPTPPPTRFRLDAELQTDMDVLGLRQPRRRMVASRGPGRAVRASGRRRWPTCSRAADHADDFDGVRLGRVCTDVQHRRQEPDFLASGEDLYCTYNVKVADGHDQAQRSATQTVTLTAVWPQRRSSDHHRAGIGLVAELPNTHGVLDARHEPVPTRHAELFLGDVEPELNNPSSRRVDCVSGFGPAAISNPVYDAGRPLPRAGDHAARCRNRLRLGGVDWTFAMPDRDLDFLHRWRTLPVTSNVTVSDGLRVRFAHTVTITMTGSEEPGDREPGDADWPTRPLRR